MCGISGWLNFDRERHVDPSLLQSMNDTLRHRGPDGDGVYVDENFAMAHRRLSIIDVAAGKQPLCNEDGSVWVSFNGEIYNYIELMEGLKQRGHRFRTKSDTEVLVHLYEERGPAMVEALQGMFAFAIWDVKTRKLCLFRDRLGKKPLYYSYQSGKHLIFASEIKAILASGEVERDVDYGGIDQYLSFLYIPFDKTVFTGIKKLPAAHFLVCQDGRVEIERYWRLNFQEHRDNLTEDQWAADFEELLTDAVRVRLRSDVPLGAFLSGGIDSTAIVSMMQELSSTPIETISVGFDEKEYNELPYAKEVSQLFGCNYNEYIVEPRVQDVFTKLITHFDEPFADSSSIPTYYVSKAARQKVTVALSGDGGDELLAGYSRHHIEVLEHRLRPWVKAVPGSLFHSLYRLMPVGLKGRNIIGDLACSPEEAAARKHSNLLFNDDLKSRIYLSQRAITDAAKEFRSIYLRSTAEHPLDKALDLDIQTYLIDDILAKVDRMSMANSLEVRAPLLDYRVLEFLAQVPPDLKLRGGKTKYLLKKVMARRVPAAILERRKHGFRLPIEVWLKGALRELVEDLLFGRSFRERGMFNVTEIQSMWSQFITGKAEFAHHFWQLIVLEQWFRLYIDDNLYAPKR